MGVWVDLQPHLLDGDAAGTQTRHLVGIVREQPYRVNALIAQDGHCSAVLPGVDRQPQGGLSIDRVEPAVLDVVGGDLAQQPNTASFLAT